MSSAGQQLVAGRIPGERIATEVVFSNSSAVSTTETAVMSVTAALVSGRTYRIVADFGFDLSSTSDIFGVRIRLTNASGTQEQLRNIHAGSGDAFQPCHIEAEHTASSTANQTFVLTFLRASGSGTCTLTAASTAPAYMYVEYIRG